MIDQFKSNEERFFFSMAHIIPQVAEPLNGMEVVVVTYEPITLRLASGTYTPDFMLWLSGPRGYLTVLFEVKGSKKQKGYKETRIRLREAARLYPMYVFVEALVDARASRFESFEFLSASPFPYSFRLPEKR